MSKGGTSVPWVSASDPSSGSGDGASTGGRSGRVQTGTGPLRVAIVEDELLIAMNIEMDVEDAGHEVIGSAMTADDAVALAERERPDIMLMDLRLAKGSSGADAARRILERFGIRSIFLSGNLTPDKRAELADLEPIAMLNKPFSPHELTLALQAVRELVN